MKTQKQRSVGTRSKTTRRARAELWRQVSALEGLEERRLLSGAAPVAVSDAYAVDEDTLLTVPSLGMPGLLSNDTDSEDPLTAVVDTQPAHGVLDLTSDGSFTYTPAANFNGADSFTYHANDGTSDSNIVTVGITVNPVNDAPTAVDDVSAIAANAALTVDAPGVLTNDSDVDLDSITAVQESGPSHGTLTLNPNGSYLYTPAQGFHGTDSFTYRASDGTLQSSPATVTITVTPVGAVPVASADTYTTGEDAALVVPAGTGVLINDTDADLDTLTAVLVTEVSQGTLTLAPDGSFNYTPDSNFNGSATFTYSAFDGNNLSDPVTVTITVTAANDAPTAVDDVSTTPANAPLTVDAPGVLTNDSDIDGDSITAVLEVGPSHGTLTLNPDGSYLYTPAQGFHSTDSFTYRASDGTLTSNVATVTITVTPVGNVPVAVSDSFTTPVNTTLNVPVGTGVLANDTDADSDPLTAVLVTDVAHGTLTLNANGSFSYTPTTAFSGADAFTYSALDGNNLSNPVTVTIQVGTNQAPVAVADTYTTNEDTALTVPVLTGVLANDTDADSNPITAVLVSTTTHGTLTLNPNGSFTYTPAANFNGTDTFTYRASDGSAQSAVTTVTLTVNAIDDAVVAVNDVYASTNDVTLTVVAPGVLANDTNVDADTLTATVVSNPLNGTLTLNSNGSFAYHPNTGFVGVDLFTYQVSDGASTSTATARITITAPVPPANQLPTASAFSVSRLPGSSISLDVLAHASDPNSDPLGITILTGPDHGRAIVDTHGTPLDLTDDTILYIPSTDFFGADSLIYQVSDGRGGTASAIATINVKSFGLSPNPFDPSKTDLIALGTTGDDVIRFMPQSKGRVLLKINGKSRGVFKPTGRIVASGFGGNDLLTAAGVNIAAVFHGGDGNDMLIGGNSNDQLFGEAGNDRLQGSNNDDLLSGGPGRNVVLG